MNYDVIIPRIKDYLLALQTQICLRLEKADEREKFLIDNWQRSEGGGGKTCVMTSGALIERGAVNFSHVFGTSLPPSASQRRHASLALRPFQATGISVVIHPRNPYVPTVHMNLRFIGLQGTDHWWFGGGFDLTPYYPFLEDCRHWHLTAKQSCDPFGHELYPQYKKNCDDYFYLQHRQEARGIGGIFFDDLNRWDLDHCFEFIKNVGSHFLTAYLPIVQRRKDMAYGERERQFQAYRRSRYVEFNLIYDRGTLFGLQSGGRVESILTSLPPHAQWQYNWQPESGSIEAELTENFLVPRDWLA